MSAAARSTILTAGAIAVLFAAPAAAEWRPSKPIEFVATAGPGGGTDNLARAVQSIVTKYKLTDQPIVVVNKGGGSGAEGYVYGKASAGDPYKVIFGTSNAWQQPLVSKVAFNYTDLTPIAAMAQDEFLLMGWSGRAPAPPAISWPGAPKRGARHVSDPQYRSRRDRHRYRQE